jgi:septum formation protein
MFKSSNGQRIVLGSSSPRRRELLTACGIEFKIESPDIDEKVLDGESPKSLVERLSGQKGLSIANRNQDAWVIAADTVVASGSQILGKPVDKNDAERMLNMLQGAWHTVWGGIAIINLQRKIEEVYSYNSEVLMRPLSATEIKAYINTGEPMDKAGSYAIQGVGAALVSEVRGSYSNVVGLNIQALLLLLTKHGAIEVLGA